MMAVSSDCCRPSFRQFALSYWGMRSGYLETLCQNCCQGKGLVLDFSDRVSILGFTVDDLEDIGRSTGFRPLILHTESERAEYLTSLRKRSKRAESNLETPDPSGEAWFWRRES